MFGAPSISLPFKLDYCHTRVAQGRDRESIKARFVSACADLGAHTEERNGRLVIEPCQ